MFDCIELRANLIVNEASKSFYDRLGVLTPIQHVIPFLDVVRRLD